MSKHAPAIVWIDARIASGLSTIKDEELAERGVDQIRYVAQERVDHLVRAAKGPDEFIVEITDSAGMLYGLTNYGRLFAYGQPIGIKDLEELDPLLAGIPASPSGWYLIAESELAP